MRIRLIKHEVVVPRCGSFEVRFSDGRPSRFFYWEDVASRPLRSEQIGSEEALEQARSVARAERDRRWAGRAASMIRSCPMVASSSRCGMPGVYIVALP